MKRNLTLVLVIVIMFVAFTGCELAPSLPEVFITVNGYSNEIIALVLPEVVGSAPDSFTDGSFITIDDGIIGRIDYTSATDLELLVTLDNWVASDGTEISGILELDFDYYTSPVYISRIYTDMAILNFDRTSVVFTGEIIDGDPATETFTFDHEMFIIISLINDGTNLINLMHIGK